MGENKARYTVDPRDFTEEGHEPQTRDTSAFRALLARGIEKAGGMAALARQLDLTASHISRLNKGGVGPSAAMLLRLAEVIDEDHIAVLRTCGHGRLADQVDRLLHGTSSRPRTLLDGAIDQLSECDRDLVAIVVARLLVNTPGPTPLPAPDAQTRSYR